jgi:chromate reductase
MDNPPFHILGIAGSLRRRSSNRGLLRAAIEVAPAGVEIEPFDLAAIPPYNADVQAAGDPPPVRELKERIRAAQALLIATPEYNTSIPGVLKNAIDWVSQPFRETALRYKPVALMGASASRFGTVRAQNDLRQVLGALGCYVLPFPFVLVSESRGRFDEEGNLTDEGVRQQVRVLVEALVDWSRRVRAD